MTLTASRTRRTVLLALAITPKVDGVLMLVPAEPYEMWLKRWRLPPKIGDWWCVRAIDLKSVRDKDVEVSTMQTIFVPSSGGVCGQKDEGAGVEGALLWRATPRAPGAALKACGLDIRTRL